MSVGLDPQQVQNIEQERRRIGRLLDEVSRLCESDIPAINFYSEMLKKLLDALECARRRGLFALHAGKCATALPDQSPGAEPGSRRHRQAKPRLINPARPPSAQAGAFAAECVLRRG